MDLLLFLFLNLTPAIEVGKTQPDNNKTCTWLASFTQCCFQTQLAVRIGRVRGRLACAKSACLLVSRPLWGRVWYVLAASSLAQIFWQAFQHCLQFDLAKKFGLINTMVFTHIPSSILLMLVPLTPTLPLAIGLLLLRFSISQMDVPTRQSYTMAVVAPDERSAASGVTAIARSVGAAVSPALTGIFFSIPALINLPFFLCGGLKIIYDLLLFREFRAVKPPEEM